MFRYLIVLAIVLVNQCEIPQSAESFSEFVENFIAEYQQLEIPELELSYSNNLNRIANLEDLKRQHQFFKTYGAKLDAFSTADLSEKEKVTKAVLDYEIELNLERIYLETKWNTEKHKTKASKLYDEALGKQWYEYFLKKWIDKDLTPDAAFQFGLNEIEKVKQAITGIQNEMGLNDMEFNRLLNDASFFIDNKKEILNKYLNLSQKVNQKARLYFPEVEQIPALTITAGTNRALAMVPAYYDNDTFFYNFFDETYDVRDTGWLYVHEGIPGHHYQFHMSEKYNLPTSSIFSYMSYIEGWAAYIEQFGKEIEAYPTNMDTYANLRWNLIRSIRVALDVGLNYYGWSDEKALNFWREHLKGNDAIAQREIKRVKRWPVQVITYKYGKHVLDRLKGDISSQEELKTFHSNVLQFGPIPLSVLEKHI